MTAVKDPTQTSDFSAIASQYESIQRQAWATQDVQKSQIDDLKTALDTYMDAHANKSGNSDILAKMHQTLDSMAQTAEVQHNEGTTNNSSWDADRVAMESLLAEIAPEGADPIYSPVAQNASAPAGGSGDPNSHLSPAADPSGTGWKGDVLDPATSATWQGLSLDDMLAKPDSLVAQELGNQPDVIAAIRKVAGETNVPTGLIAAMIVQETNGNRNDISSHNPGYEGVGAPYDQQVDAGLIQAPLWQFAGSSTAEKKASAADPYTNLSNFANWAKDTYATQKSWGQVANMWYTGEPAARLDGQSAGGSDETHYVQNVLGNLGMGGSSYYG